jgi:hypothetical protein
MICVGVALVSPMYAFEGGSENVALGILVIAAEVRFRPRHRRLTALRISADLAHCSDPWNAPEREHRSPAPARRASRGGECAPNGASGSLDVAVV